MNHAESLDALLAPVKKYLCEIDPTTLPSLAIDGENFHYDLPKKPGIYYLVHADINILYIGMSVNLSHRWIKHTRKSISIKLCNVRLHWFEVGQNLPTLEEILIRHFNPFWNRVNNPKHNPGHPYCHLHDYDKWVKTQSVLLEALDNLPVYMDRIPKGMLTVRQVMELMGVEHGVVHSWIRYNLNNCILTKCGNYLIDKAAFENFLEDKARGSFDHETWDLASKRLKELEAA